MSLRLCLSAVAAIAWAAFPSAGFAAQSGHVEGQTVRPAADPNQRICEDVTVVGSRLGTKRICATRSEWAEMRKRDRDVVDQAQRSPNVGCSVINSHSGTPTC